MTAAFSALHRTRTIVFLGICILAGIAAAVVGIDDNPPGIFLAYLAAIALVLAFVHPWRTARQFLYLLIGSVLGHALSAILNNLIAAVAHAPGTTGVLQKLLQGFAVAAFILATLICPAAFIVGAAGSVAMLIRNRRRLA